MIAILAAIVAVSTVGGFFSSIHAPEPGAPQPRPEVTLTSFELVTPAQPDAQDKSLLRVSTQDVTVEAGVTGVREVIVLYGLEGDAAPARATGEPDSSGHVEVTLHLPRTGAVYVIDAYGIVADKLIPDWKGGFFDARPAIEAPATLHVEATS
ncbi:MAG TPA: hypothetical protein VFY10_07130 [Dehalococcoidia bacterium]|nr:hypothetical protein [Dehalococcoidia bacterium]